MTLFAVILILLAAIMTMGLGSNIAALHTSDPAGNGLLEAYSVFLAIAVWIIVCVLLLICGARDGFPHYSGFAMFLALVLGIAAQVMAMQVLISSKAQGAAATLLPIVTVAAPLLALIRAAWGIFPPLRSSIPEIAGSWAPIILLALIPLLPIPFYRAYLARESAAHTAADRVRAQAQQQQNAQDEQRVQETLANIAALPADGELFSALVFCADPDPRIRDAARAKARAFTNRQPNAEALLAEGHEPTLREIPNFDLQPTPPLCNSAKKILAAKEQLKPFDNDPIRIEDAEREIGAYIETMRWLLSQGCDCKAEISGLEQAVGRFADSERRRKLLAGLAAARTSP